MTDSVHRNKMAPKTPQRRLSHTERARIHSLRYDSGLSLALIAYRTGILKSTVHYCVKAQITPTKPQGRRPKLDTPTRQRLIKHATTCQEQRIKPFREIAYKLSITANKRTLTKAFEKEGYYRRVATKKPLLTPKHMNNRAF